MTSDQNVNILLVDDQPSNLLALESILAEDDRQLIVADSGRAALKQLLDHEFAVILLDVQMPDLDGFETASLIRQRDKSRDTPIIFVTALSRSETNVFRGYELGAVDYIFKPIQAEILRSKVNVFVELFRKNATLRQQATELARLSKQNELILNAVAEGVFGIDLDGRTTFVNRAAARMIGRRVDEVRGQDIHALVHPALTGVVTCNVEKCRFYAALHRQEMLSEGEETFFRSDGSSFPVDFCASEIRDANGQPFGSVVTFRDVTERRSAALAAEAERRYREAEAANRAKDHFLATLSHELRTPMTSILGWVQFLRIGGYSPEELAEALQTIETSARLQARLIDDMLDVSRIVLGKFQVDLRPTRIADVIEPAITTARPVAAAQDVKLTWDVGAGDEYVAADCSRMQQVIGNILSNAIKFSRPGGEVELAVVREDGKLRICVTDHGEGIEPSFLPHVFERLRQGNVSSRTGLGLGLAIARHIVDLHHGDITAESNGVGKGARFTVLLPTMELAAAGARTSRPQSVGVAPSDHEE